MPDCEWKTEIYEVMTLANRGAGQTSRRRRLQKQFVADGRASDRARLGCLHSCVWSGPRQCGSSSFRDHNEKKQTCKKNLPRLSSDSRTRRWALISAEAEGKHCACLRRLYIVLSHRWRKVFIFTSNRLGEPAAAVISFSSVPWLRFYNWEIKMKETAVGVKSLPRLVQD